MSDPCAPSLAVGSSMRERAVERLPPISELLTHRPPMLLLDEVEQSSPDRIVCTTTVRGDAPFVEEGRLPAVAMLEYMAQCVAAFAGLDARRRGQPIRVGLLIGCRDLELFCDSVAVGTELGVEAERVWGQRELGYFRCVVGRDDCKLARGSLSVALAGAGVGL